MSLERELELSSEGSSTSSSSSRSSTNSSIASPVPEVNESSLHLYRCLRSFRQQGGDHHHQGLEQSVFSLALHEELLAGGLSGNQISIWRSSSASQLCTLRAPPHAGAVKALLMAGDRLFSAHQDHKIRVWRVSDLQHCLLATLPSLRNRLMDFPIASQHSDAVSCLAITDKLLYSASWDMTVKVWRLSDFKCLESFVAHSRAINAIVVDPHKGLLFTGSADSSVKIWQRTKDSARRRKKAHHLIFSLPQHDDIASSVNALALSPDGERLFTGRSDSSILVWGPMKNLDDIRDHAKSGDSSLFRHSRLIGHQQSVLCLATLGNLLCSGSADRTIRLWKSGGALVHDQMDECWYTCVSVIRGSNGPVKSLALKLDKLGFCNVYSGGLDCEIKLWRINYTPEGPDDSWRNMDRISEHFYFTSECNDNLIELGEGSRAPWKLKAIRCALEEETAHFLLAFQALEC